MVGAIVGSQPFGGRGLSGNGCKAGGPNYLKQFLNEKVVSKNSVAFGGNAELLNIQEE
jgi:RHH-type proline utilization regulon transcriptional repressor/proline dehydrogenase/delta 1-pyrroline-5-carboxylate dehydrogenase